MKALAFNLWKISTQPKLLVFCLFALFSCSKSIESEKAANPNFIRVYNTNEGAYSNYFVENADASFFAFQANPLAENLSRLVVDKFGNTLNSEPIEMDELTGYHGLHLRSGEHIFKSSRGTRIIKYSSDGTLLVNEDYPILSSIFNYSGFYEDNQGNLYNASFSGGTNNAKAGIIYQFDSYPNYKNEYPIYQSDFGGYECGDIKLVHANDSAFYLLCSVYGSFLGKVKLIYGVYDRTFLKFKSLKIFDDDDYSESDYLTAYTSSKAGNFAAITSNNIPGDLRIKSEEFELFVWDNEFELAFRKRINLHNDLAYITHLLGTKDGGYLVSGFIEEGAAISKIGFSLKLNSQGEQEFVKYYREVPNLTIIQSDETSDGSFLITGSSIGFGSGKNYRIPVIIKTNKYCELE